MFLVSELRPPPQPQHLTLSQMLQGRGGRRHSDRWQQPAPAGSISPRCLAAGAAPSPPTPAARRAHNLLSQVRNPLSQTAVSGRQKTAPPPQPQPLTLSQMLRGRDLKPHTLQGRGGRRRSDRCQQPTLAGSTSPRCLAAPAVPLHRAPAATSMCPPLCTRALSRECIHMHFLSLSLSLCPSIPLSRSLSCSLARSLSLALSPPLSLSHTLSLSMSLCLLDSLSRSLSLSLCLSLSQPSEPQALPRAPAAPSDSPLSRSLSLALALSLSLSLSLSRSRSPLLARAISLSLFPLALSLIIYLSLARSLALSLVCALSL